MILTITTNPTIDRVYYLPKLEANSVHRATKEVYTPSGKGVDVSIFLTLLQKPTIALGLNAGHTGNMLVGLLDEMDVPHDFVRGIGETRTVPVLVDQTTGAEYTITAPSLQGSEVHLEKLLQKLDHYAHNAWGMVCAGSLAQGLPDDSYAQLLRRGRQHGLVTLLDVSGKALSHAIESPPDILKINHAELAALDTTFAPHSETISASQGEPPNLSVFAATLQHQLGTLAHQAIIISMGEHGALAVTNDGHYYAGALDVPVAVTNGAGDAMDAGILMAMMDGKDWFYALRLGTAAAAAAVMHDGTAGCDPTHIPQLISQVEVVEIK
ncbi:hexose kinase [Chloroflexi bacterium TSY]|nr:hexose kinase [Chloroflexi bacterium TSY]